MRGLRQALALVAVAAGLAGGARWLWAAGEGPEIARVARYGHALGQFPLTGKHAAVGCSSCHVGGKSVGTTRACKGCT